MPRKGVIIFIVSFPRKGVVIESCIKATICILKIYIFTDYLLVESFSFTRFLSHPPNPHPIAAGFGGCKLLFHLYSYFLLCPVRPLGVDFESENVSSDDSGCDLDPLPDLPNIEPSFAVHVVAIFRAIIRGYATVELDSEKAAIWHKFMNAPRDSLATVRDAIRRTQRVGHVRKERNELSDGINLSAEQRAELEIDRRAIRNALRTAKAGNLGKATRILDNVYKDSTLSAEEKFQKLRELHPDGPPIQIPEADFPRIGVVESSELRLAVEKLARGASPGPSGLSESMMRLLVDDDVSCLSLCHMVRDVINGEVPLSVRKRLTRCRIIALPKPQNGICPVAMGDTILKICGSILLQRHETTLKTFFAPIQRGVLHKNACESIVHELLQE